MERSCKKKHVSLNRREFCIHSARAALWGTGALLLAPPWKGLARAEGSAGLAAVKGAAASAARRAVELLGGMGSFVSPGQRVVVKPNIGWDRTPEQAANTSPEVVAEVVKMCLDAGAKEVLVFDRTCNDPRLSYRRSGIKNAVEGLGKKEAKLFHPDKRKYVVVPISGGESLKEWKFYEDALGADVYINVPIAKHHGLSGVTMGMKNIMGVIGGNRGQIHTGFDDKIVDLNLARPSHLTILDATRILVAHGPQGGKLEDVRKPGTVVAGTDIVAVDAYSTRFFNRRPEEIAHIRRAHDRGLGTMDISKMKVREESL